MEKKVGEAKITAECRSDGLSVASDLFATYPCRLHLTSRPNYTFMQHQNQPDEDDKGNSIASKALTCYILGYGGGLISGDDINLDITVKPKASLVITSQSTSKAFKAIPGRDATLVKTRATVGHGGLLFLVPQPMQCFGGSKLEQETHVVLEGGLGLKDVSKTNMQQKHDPSLLLVDWYTGGRKNLDGGVWKMETFHTLTTISYSKNELFPSDLESEDEDEDKHDSVSQIEANNKKLSQGKYDNKHDLVFRDTTRLSGGDDLIRHMRHFNIVCMVALIGPRVKVASDRFLEKFSSRDIYDEKNDREGDNLSSKKGIGLNQNRGEGLNSENEGLLVSCGKFSTEPGSKEHDSGVIVRLAADSLEIAAKFLSKHIGTLGGQLDDDPFLEILTSKQGVKQHVERVNTNADYLVNKSTNIPVGLIRNSFKGQPEPHMTPFNGDSSPSGGIGNTSPILLYQLVDSCVPSGGFAHSNTLEAAHQLHLFNKLDSSWKNSLREHCFDVVLQTFTSMVPFLLSSCDLFRNHYHKNDTKALTEATLLEPPPKHIMELWQQFDSELRATITSHVASRASTTQGSGMLRAFSAAFPNIAPVIKIMRKYILRVPTSQTDCAGHCATSFGAVCGLLNINNYTCVSMFLYTTARDMVNAAVRMNLIGPLEGGLVTNELCSGIDELIRKYLVEAENVKSLNCAHQVVPLVEVLSNAHDRLYSRLFNS